MSVDLKVNIAQVNFSNFLRVTAAKVSAPTVVVFQTYIATPFVQHNLVIPNLDPENYYISFYEAASVNDNGIFRAQLYANALTGAIEYERRFYTTDGPGTGDPLDGDTTITDPYLIGKTITGIFKEGFRFLNPASEWSFDTVTGIVTVLNGTQFSSLEQIVIDLKYAGGVQAAQTGGGLYTGTLDVPEDLLTLNVLDINKRIRCICPATRQVITLPDINTVADGDGFYFDNSSAGVAYQPEIATKQDAILFNGFNLPNNTINRLWLGSGEHFLLKKYAGNWEVITDYKGANVGERIAAGFGLHPNTLPEDGTVYDGEDYPRLYWWLTNVLPAAYKYSTPIIVLQPDPEYRAQFGLHSSSKNFRMPDTRGLVDKGLTDYAGAADTLRIPNRPGIVQNEAVKSHDITLWADKAGSGGVPNAFTRPGVSITGAQRAGEYRKTNAENVTLAKYEGSTKNLVDNNGVIYLRRI